MKKILTLSIVAVLVLALCSCGAPAEPELTPMEKLNAYMDANGTIEGSDVIAEYAEGSEFIAAHDFTLSHLGENSAFSRDQKFELIKSGHDFSVKLTDMSIADNGLKMERTVVLNFDGTFTYANLLILNGSSMGVTLKGELVPAAYSKDKMPAVTDSTFSTGAKMTDDVKSAMKEYVDLTIDCFGEFLGQESLNLSLSDVGFSAYIEETPSEVQE